VDTLRWSWQAPRRQSGPPKLREVLTFEIPTYQPAMLPMPSGSRAEILVRQIKLVALLRGRGDSEVCARCLSDAPRERVPGISWDAVSTPSKEQSGLRLRSNRKPSPARCSPDSLQGVPQRPLRGACRIASEVLGIRFLETYEVIQKFLDWEPLLLKVLDLD
jgi:hypothetical protein